MLLPFLLISFLLFIFGAAIGSFLNVVIYRTINEESWVVGRSKCEHCGKQISWRDNIPLLSYLRLKGKCRHCHKPITLAHPVVEFLTGSLFVWWFWGGSLFFRLSQHPFQTLQPIFWLTVGILLLIIFVADWRYYIIPDIAVGILLMMTLAYRLTLTAYGVMQVSDLLMALWSLVGVVSLFFILWLITKGKGFGLGDVKLAAPLALLLGWPKILVGVFFAFIIGGIAGIILLISGKKKFGQVVPFGPFLVLGTFIALLWGEAIWSWYLSLMG